jgi:predicted transcriptional regulator
MSHRDLFDIEPLARRTDPETSHEAAERMKPLAPRDRLAVLLAHWTKPDGMTDFELAASLGRQQTSVGKRRGELRDAGLITDAEIRRKSPSGSTAIVWRITAKGMAMAREMAG